MIQGELILEEGRRSPQLFSREYIFFKIIDILDNLFLF